MKSVLPNAWGSKKFIIWWKLICLALSLQEERPYLFLNPFDIGCKGATLTLSRAKAVYLWTFYFF